MAMKKVAHVVERPGRKFGDAPVSIPVPVDSALHARNSLS